MNGPVYVYVPLLDEGTDVWRPVLAERVAPGLFRLNGPIPEGELWQFQPGEVVRCENRRFSTADDELVAVTQGAK